MNTTKRNDCGRRRQNRAGSDAARPVFSGNRKNPSPLAESNVGAENFPGRWRSNAAAGGPLEVILAEVLRRLAGDGHLDPELVCEVKLRLTRLYSRCSRRKSLILD
jgi:hypothetical protein